MYKLALRLVKRARLLSACRAPDAVRLQDVVCGEIKVRMLLRSAKLGNIHRQQLPLPADPCASGICLGYLRHQPSICTPLCFIDLRSTGSTAAVGSCKILCVYQQA